MWRSSARKRTAGVIASTLVLAAAAGGARGADGPTIIDLTQTGCQFLEAEGGVDHGFKTTKKADCEAINARTGAERLAATPALELPPGRYVFRVVNRDVPYELGFWLREADYELGNPLHKLTKTSVSGGGLATGAAQDYEVELGPGEYLYSCPLNPTPDYRLVVKAN